MTRMSGEDESRTLVAEQEPHSRRDAMADEQPEQQQENGDIALSETWLRSNDLME